MSSTTEQRERLEALMDAFSTTIDDDTVTLTALDRYADPNEPLSDSDIPGYFIGRAGRAEHERQSASEIFTSRRWLIWIVAAEVLDDTVGAKEEADQAAEDLLDSVIQYLHQHPQLELEDTDNGLSGLQGVSIKDDGVKEYQRSTKRYSAIPIMVDIASIRQTWRNET